MVSASKAGMAARTALRASSTEITASGLFPVDRTVADVRAEKYVVPANFRDRIVGSRGRSADPSNDTVPWRHPRLYSSALRAPGLRVPGGG